MRLGNNATVKRVALLLIPPISLAWVAFANGYPLVFYDTGTYLRSGFEGYVPVDRPVFYGVFIRACAILWHSTWSVVAAQVLLVVACVKLSAPALSTGRFIVVLVMLGVGTSLPWHAGQLIPDVFAATLMLSGLALVFGETERWNARRGFLAGVFLLSLLVHTSHVLIVAGGLALLGLAAAVRRQPTWLRRGLVPAGLMAASLVAVPLSHKVLTGEAYFSKAGHVFLMANLVRWGVAQQYLEEHCSEAQPPAFCQYLPELRTPEIAQDFLWHPQSPLQALGGWSESREATLEVIRPAVAENAGLTIQRASADFLRQLVTMRTGDDARPYADELVVVKTLQRLFPAEYPQFASSLQQRGDLQRMAIIMSWLHLAVLVAALGWLTLRTKWDAQLLGLVSLIIVNAFVCGVLSAPDDRYQSRVAWLLVLAALILPIRTRSGEPGASRPVRPHGVG